VGDFTNNLDSVTIKNPNLDSIKIAVYTCITGNYDKLMSPTNIDSRIDYYCFSDNIKKPTNSPWILKPVNLNHLNSKDQNRFIKMHPHEFLENYDVTIYVDGNIQIVGDIFELVQMTVNTQANFFIYNHPYRTCIFTEAAACAHFSHDWIWKIALQMRRYCVEGYPADNGLFEASVIIRKNTNSIRELMEMWWDEYCLGAKRDQLSLPVVAWRLGIQLESLGKSDPRFGHRYFKYVFRPNRRSLKLIIRKYMNRSIASLVTYKKLFSLNFPFSWK